MTNPIYIQNKYQVWYHNIISNAIVSNRIKNPIIYFESHHIIPKSFGGSNSKDNLVLLTAKEHFVCHELLIKFTTKQYKHKMLHALNLMFQSNNLQIRYNNANIYESIKKELSNFQRGKGNPFYKKHHTIESKLKISKANSGRKLTFSESHKINISKAQTGKKNWQWRGDYHTPWGIFTTAKEASILSPIPISLDSIKRYCKNSNKIITNFSISHSIYLQSLKESPLGKTFGEIGFYFELI